MPSDLVCREKDAENLIPGEKDAKDFVPGEKDAENMIPGEKEAAKFESKFTFSFASRDTPNGDIPEESSYPNDDKPDEDLDEESFNPNDDLPDEDLDEESFNPNDDKPDEDLDEESFNPNDDVPDEDLDEESFNPNDDVPDEDLDEESFNPNDEVPNENPEEINNPDNSGTVTIVISEEPEKTSEQESEKEPEQESESGPENDPEQELERDWEIVTPEGEPEKPGEPPEVVEMRADLEEWGYPSEPDEDYSPPEPESDQTSDQEHENQPESESQSEPEQEPEKEWDLINPETGEPVPKQVAPEMIPLEDKIEDVYREQQESPNEESNTVPEQQPESEPKQESEKEWESINPETDPELMPLNDQEPEVIPEQELIRELEDIPELEPEQKPVKIQKKKPIKVKKVEVITDPEELGGYKPYEYEHIVGTPYDYKPEQEPKKKSSQKKKPVKAQKKKPIKVKKVEVITDPKELGDYEPNEYERIIGTRFYRPEQEPKKKPSQKRKPVKAQKKKPIKVKKIEAITDHEEHEEPTEKPIDTKKTPQTVQKKIVEKKEKTGEKEKETKESETFLVNKTKSKQQTIQQIKAKAETKKQETIKSIEKPETEQMERYRQETGRRPIYSGKKTKGFLLWLKKQKQISNKKRVSSKKESNDDWEVLLEKWIREADEKEVPDKIKIEILEKIRKYRKLRELNRKLIALLRKENLSENEIAEVKNLIKKVKDMNPLQEEIFESLRAFKNFYNKNIHWFEYRIEAERKDFTRHLARKLELIKKKNINSKNVPELDHNWKKSLEKALESITPLDDSEKQIIIQILKKNDVAEQQIKKLASILSKLNTEQLIDIFGENFKLHTQNYVKWGFDFYRNIKMDILKQFFIRKLIPDAGALFKAIRKQLSFLPRPCYCIRKAIENVEFFSLFLGLKAYYVTYKSQRSQKGKQLGLDILKIISSNLRKSFEYWILKESDPKITNKIKNLEIKIGKIIENYKNAHKLKLYALGGNGILEQHPNLKLDYFKEIDTLEKAYWLGWLFAEGYITIKRIKSGKEYYRFGVGCLQDDFILLERFADALGIDIVNIVPSKEEYRTSKGEVHVLRRIKLINNEFCKNLISHGFIVGKRKSKNIRLPRFKHRELLLAFLLGYYDGDGTIRRSRITSSSKKLLADILNSPFLNIPVSNSNSIQYDPVKKKYIIKGDKISLGADLMREMVKNYKNSLPRKRAFWENWVDKRTLKPTPKMDILSKKLPKEKLLNLLKKFTLKQIAYMYGVGYRTLMTYKSKLNIYLRDRSPENS